MGLYDQYQLANSTAIPMYEGSAGAEAIQVGSYLQGQYDVARTGAGEISDMSQNIQTMDHPGDIKLAQDLRNHVDQSINTWSSAKDWENHVEDVKSLGRNYVNRAKELATPLAVYQDWKEKDLNNKDLGLTPDQKISLDAMARTNYQGLKKDATGRYVGAFQKPDLAKNIDVNKFADDAIKEHVDAEGGSEMTNDNGYIKYKVGNTYKVLTPERVLRIVADARNNSVEYQAFAKQEGGISGFKNGRMIRNLDDAAPAFQGQIKALTDQGYTVSQAANVIADKYRQNQISSTMDDYAVTKYAHNNRTSINDTEVGDLAKDKIKKEADLTATIATATLDNPAQNFQDIETQEKTATDNLTTARDNIERTKAVVAQDYDKAHGAGSYEKLDDNTSEGVINAYFDKLGTAGNTMRTALASDRENFGRAQQDLGKAHELRSAVDAFTLNKMGYSKDTWDNKVKTSLVAGLKGSDKVTVSVNGEQKEITQDELKSMVNSGDVSAKTETRTTPAGYGPGGGTNLDVPTVTVKTKDGKTVTFDGVFYKNKAIGNVIDKVADLGDQLNTNRKKFAKEALDNYSQSTGIVSTNNEPINDVVKRTIQSAEKKIYDAAGNPIKAGSDEETKLQGLINNGNFVYNGTFTENKPGQNSMVQITVKDPDDKNATPVTYRVGVNGMTNNILSDHMMKEGVEADGVTIKNPKIHAAALALRDGSAYNKINKVKVGRAATVYQKVGGIWKPYATVDKGPVNGMPTTTFTRQGQIIPGEPMDIGAYLEQYAKDGNYKVTF